MLDQRFSRGRHLRSDWARSQFCPKSVQPRSDKWVKGSFLESRSSAVRSSTWRYIWAPPKICFSQKFITRRLSSLNDMVAAKFGRQAISRMNWSPEAKLNICTDTPPFLGRRFKENVTFFCETFFKKLKIYSLSKDYFKLTDTLLPPWERMRPKLFERDAAAGSKMSQPQRSKYSKPTKTKLLCST